MSNPLVLASKEFYLMLVQFASKRAKKKNDKIIFLLSFPEASKPTLQLLYEHFPDKLVICYAKNAKDLAEFYENKGCPIYCIDTFSVLIKDVVPIVSSSKLVFCDNYFAFLARITFNNKASVVQLWHANGAIKLFGLEAKYTKNVTKRDRERYIEVYNKFTHYVVSSQKMADIFAKNYQQTINKLPFGYLPTDLFFDQEWLQRAKKQFKHNFPTNKKIALYVPTYREHQSEVPLDFFSLKRQLNDGWLVMVKPHPHDKGLYQKVKDIDGIISDFKEMNLAQILPSVDCLITDYSSIPFEYSLANPNGKMVFFCYDYEEYKKEVGIEEGFQYWAPGKIVKKQNELVSVVQTPSEEDFETFNQMWNEYAHGSARKQLLKWVKNVYDN
ncbi:CDP-glycerol glycerophosphotransferase [Tetragenococcus halophilus]|uniref:CDP-glycerol glycerophosphotransferase family protein n=1 Tax=Tetragenococcus halophilus TaxID=51669 RepID=UPI0019271BFA|nr:CDP-glycerol glycerophosphotransferase family protein [Tetragenococcus halophilus]GEQ38836.1 CDP-glycerol glycerophosphotransferase [Tetragenococcus halophilus]GEQ41101.1 CDP-glycerol glycerophosphotransferase [Tetragenococcus halophilus]GEQ43353.1 CDP-glycerol glycerophosphotransferase [Tetragenococcus halophilus]GEQ45598.1 CDP-glycerol glycerophosphotransferase [Tetragenococcus halophilus]GEQ47857.1 CDP-glycerol glycerophosphotransferase [Tetragenococcus halophilus]